MKRFTFITMFIFSLIIAAGCAESTTTGTTDCGTYEGFPLQKDSQGCYYMVDNQRFSAPSTACQCD